VRFCFYTEDLGGIAVLCVDGIAPKGLNLSHWPGNRTPQDFKADSSTEIVLLFNKSPERDALISGLDIVSNTHYDTDGYLSVAAVLYPEKAGEISELLIETAITGDFRRYTRDAALKLDLVISGFSGKGSPIYSQIKDMPEAEKRQMLYDRLLEEFNSLESLADRYPELWEDEFYQIKRELEGFDQGKIRVDHYPDADLSVIYSVDELHEITRNTLCPHSRLLWCQKSGDYYQYRFWYLVDSWFELVSRKCRARHDLNPLLNRLKEMEYDRNIVWKSGSLSDPVVTVSAYDEKNEVTESTIHAEIVCDEFLKYLVQQDNQEYSCE